MVNNLSRTSRPELVIEERRKNSSDPLLQFPSDLSAQCMLLIFKDYEYTRPGNVPLNKSNTGIIANAKSTSSILLPIPSNLKDNLNLVMSIYSPSYAAEIVSGAISDTANLKGTNPTVSDYINNITKSVKENISNGKIDNIGSILSDVSYMARSQLESKIPGSANAIDVALGNTVNPKSSLIFNGVNLKNHHFTWVLAPKNRKESDDLMKITNLIKQKILPSYGNLTANSSDKVFLNYPNTVDIYLLGVQQDYFMFFKKAMVADFTVNYTPHGLSFLTGGKPSSVEMSMNLVETDIHVSTDYGANVSTKTNTL